MPRTLDLLSLRHYGPSAGSHAHDHFQVLLGVEGVLELEVQGKGKRLAPGAGCVIAPGERHDFEAQTGARCLVLDTTHPAWATCPEHPTQSASALALADYLQLALAQPQALARQYGPQLLLDCWRKPPDAPSRSQRSIDWAALAHWAQGHLHHTLAVADLAAQVFLSPTQFATRCRLETGMSPMQWLRDLRMARARALRAQGLAGALVAERCGYRSASALVAALRQHGHAG
ncbi:MAG: AraC family transcriptional regulator [Burkholderiales bacterium RIFCSPLOWO2_12_FULL_61_40]|nr:MAG: AraC family transcriptional regulator [Burkholderiales bacterium RIFCSPLOWO2_12_FULL_61_40]